MVTNPKIIFIVVIAMALFVVIGMVGTFVLILKGSEGAMVAIMAGFTGTALGQLGGMLNNTRTQASEPIPTQSVRVDNDKNNPVQTEEIK